LAGERFSHIKPGIETVNAPELGRAMPIMPR
jgi:hypothetical protein